MCFSGWLVAGLGGVHDHRTMAGFALMITSVLSTILLSKISKMDGFICAFVLEKM
jgi:hypothetical protein